MRYQLDLVLKPAEGALIRVIGMAERRGFSPCAITGTTDTGDGRWRVQLVVEGGQRPAETLRRQLEKVYDCETVAVQALAPAAVGAAA